MKYFTRIIITSIVAMLFSFNHRIAGESYYEKEKVIKDYFGGWVKKDWNQVSGQLANGFTFTSPNDDDHISIEKFKEKCWVQAAHIVKFEFIKITGDENEAFVLVHVLTKANKVIRNIEYFNFANGKIKSIEVFFGGTGQGFPTNEK